MTLFGKMCYRLKLLNLSTYHNSCSEIKDLKQTNHNAYGTRKQHMFPMKESLCPTVAHVQPYKLCPIFCDSDVKEKTKIDDGQIKR